jgi:predicted PurR-regulated permease PerM
MHDLQQSVKKWEQERLMSNNGGGVSRSDYVLEKLRQSFEGIPLAQTGLNYLEQMLKDPAFREKITAGIINSRGDVGETVTRIFSTAAAVVCDILLTIFFALLFLLKFAEFHAKNKEKKSGSEYVVRNIFNGVWLPDAGEKVVEDTCRIINGILFRLRRWLKGYITLILVDSTVYTICFFFLGVPFFLPLGMIAGCGIALPYLGPVISCVLTLTVSIAAGGATVEMITAIVICYLIYNGIIEQFILYPAVIGDSLGLNTLETIIVVLLGALFAGIPGMIFSLPTASVAKYIIPMIYHGFTAGQSTEERGIS